MAMMSRLLQNIGLFCRIGSLLQGSFANETYFLREPTNRSHFIALFARKRDHLVPNANRATVIHMYDGSSTCMTVALFAVYDGSSTCMTVALFCCV